MATNAVVFKGATGTLTEQPGSPSYSFGEASRCTRIYRGLYSLALASAVPKGTVGAGEMLGYSVAQCSVTKEKFGIGVIRIDWEVSGPDAPTSSLPPDETQITPYEIHPAVERAPAFAELEPAVIDRCYTAARGATYTERMNAYDWLEVPTNAPDAARVLRDEMMKGADTYYLAGLRYEWTFHTYVLPALTRGGFVQTPGGPAELVLPSNVQFLRLSDSYSEQGGLYRITRAWLGAPSSAASQHWSSTIYSLPS